MWLGVFNAAAFVVPLILLLSTGSTWKSAAGWAVVAGYAIIVAPFVIGEILFPKQFLLWRSRAGQGQSPAMTQVAGGFDKVLSPKEQSNHPYRRVRLFGVTLLVVTLVVDGVLVWILFLAKVI